MWNVRFPDEVWAGEERKFWYFYAWTPSWSWSHIFWESDERRAAAAAAFLTGPSPARPSSPSAKRLFQTQPPALPGNSHRQAEVEGQHLVCLAAGEERKSSSQEQSEIASDVMSGDNVKENNAGVCVGRKYQLSASTQMLQVLDSWYQNIWRAARSLSSTVFVNIV